MDSERSLYGHLGEHIYESTKVKNCACYVCIHFHLFTCVPFSIIYRLYLIIFQTIPSMADAHHIINE